MTKRWRLCVLLSTALLTVGCKKGEGPTGPSPIPEPNSTINYTAIGASDALGIGASNECLPYVECPNGKGYVQVTTRELRARGFIVNLNNLGIPTAVISRRMQDLAAQYGRFVLGNFIEQEAPFVTTNATVVTIFAGANDVNTITGALSGGASSGDQAGFINSQIRAFGDDFTMMLNIIRERASSARIIALNLPNMGAMPFLAGSSLQHRQTAQMLSVEMTRTVINPRTSEGLLIVDLMCDPRSYQASTYSADGFHPSETGYAWIAAEVIAGSNVGISRAVGKLFANDSCTVDESADSDRELADVGSCDLRKRFGLADRRSIASRSGTKRFPERRHAVACPSHLAHQSASSEPSRATRLTPWPATASLASGRRRAEAQRISHRVRGRRAKDAVARVVEPVRGSSLLPAWARCQAGELIAPSGACPSARLDETSEPVLS